MRIGSRIVIVGAIPILIAAAIGLAAILLLQQANRARSGAALAGTVFRTLLVAVTARNDYLNDAPNARSAQERRFFETTRAASRELDELHDLQPDDDGAAAKAQSTLDQYAGDMRKLVGVTADNDRMAEAMTKRAETLIGLTDQARERQHASNADVVRSLKEGDAKLRAARDIVDSAYATRLALASLATEIASGAAGAAGDIPARRRRLLFDLDRLAQTSADLIRRIQERKNDEFSVAAAIASEIAPALDTLAATFRRNEGVAPPDAAGMAAIQDIAQWAERILKVYSAEYRSFHEEAAQLLTYSVQAQETELATQNIAIDTLKISNQSAAALSRRDEATARALVGSSLKLSDTIAALPISPLIQSEMIEAFARWRDGLQASTKGIGTQNTLMADMDSASAAMIAAARSLNETFSDNAERTARSIQDILVIGAASGLLLGGIAALLVARSITNPLVDLQTRITEMAQNQNEGLIEDGGRWDELGDIARATNVFLVEIARRERALRRAKEQADEALTTLRRTQVELIQAEKLASLGQLVAGVAHEINTPIGIALTTSTVVDEEARRFRASMKDGRVSRAALERMVERVSEGAGLLGANLTRAADLIQSFKQTAADRVSGEAREFEVRTFLHQLLTSLGPMLRKSGHAAQMDCPEGLVLDSAPGAIAQVITNLVVNASLHAFEAGQAGTITVTAEPQAQGVVRFTVGDDGRGIAIENRARVFDPFFTTRRAQGSTGLGLQIVFNLVTATLQGRIEMHSEVGAGTRFVIDLPRLLQPARFPPQEQDVTA